MNHGENRRGGSYRRDSPASGKRVSCRKDQSPVRIWVPKNNSVCAKDEHNPVQKPDESAAFKCSESEKDLLQSSASSRGCEVAAKDGVGSHCDPLNRMKDVPLRDHKVEISSVEDHDSVAGNSSSNERKTRPFDLFRWSNVKGLKHSIREVNREKKEATTGFTGIVLRPGMVLLKNYLSINDQVMVVNKCRQLGLGEGGFYRPGYSDGAKLRLNMMCLGKNWDPQTSQYGDTRPVDGSVPPQIPVEFSELVGKAIKESQSLVATYSKKMNGEDEIPSMSPDICIVNFYTSTGRLGLHKDKDESKKSIRKGLPVVSFSIGDSAEFVYGDQRDEDKTEIVVLESGDVLLFGGKSRSVFHGVKSILKDTAPKDLVQETNLRPGRLNLTFRQY